MLRAVPAFKPLMISLAIAALSACGGGSGSSSGAGQAASSSDRSVAQGQFLDSAVSGLWYETPTHSGFTDESGSFSYVPGESITFYLGSTFIGKVLAQAEITPLDLMTAVDDPDKLQNLLRTLQTLDADSDPSNGITINPTAQAYLDQFVLPLNSPAFLFEASSTVQDMIAAVTNGTDLKNAVDSFTHFRETMLSTRRSVDTTPILNLLNTTWDVEMTSSNCGDVSNTQLVYRFNSLGLSSSGFHRLVETTDSKTGETICKKAGYGVLISTYETDPLFTCANQCLDSDLNRVILEQDENGDVVTTLNYDEQAHQITIRTTRFNGTADVTTTRILTQR